MRLIAAILGACLALAVAAHAEDESSPHHMTKSNGELDMEKCGACHNEDMSLQRSKVETCTLCHGQTPHAGSDEHLRASAPDVKRALAGQPKDAPALPLTDDGRMYCATCHLFHDPKVMSEDWLAHGWLPPDIGVTAAIRQGVVDRWAALAEKAGEKGPVGTFATKGTRQLRLPVNDGQLCRQCHGALR